MKIVKFFSTSLVATAADFLIYLFLVTIISPVLSHFISATCGMIINFILQRKWVFNATRELKTSFLLSLIFSIGGIILGGFIIYLLIMLSFFEQNPIFAKIVVIGIIFIYNYQTKKIAFGDR
ncbi:GtrA family protein [Sulfurovum sp.]|uniref:GtrA family protein n=1 Tax=Sulfurovum sp. TaxID=1969726 RepID=UPI00356A52CA